MKRNIRQIGEAIAAVSTPFELPPDFPKHSAWRADVMNWMQWARYGRARAPEVSARSRCCCWRPATGSRACRPATFRANLQCLAGAVDRERARRRSDDRPADHECSLRSDAERLFGVFGAEWAQRIAVSIAVLTFVWGAFAFVSAVARGRAWHLLPCIAMLAYGWVFHMGFFNFYLSMGLCFWAMRLAWDLSPRRVSIAASAAGRRLRAACPAAWSGPSALLAMRAGAPSFRGWAVRT